MMREFYPKDIRPYKVLFFDKGIPFGEIGDGVGTRTAEWGGGPKRIKIGPDGKREYFNFLIPRDEHKKGPKGKVPINVVHRRLDAEGGERLAYNGQRVVLKGNQFCRVGEDIFICHADKRKDARVEVKIK